MQLQLKARLKSIARAFSASWQDLDNPALWFDSLAGPQTASGIRVSPALAMQVSAVYACVKVLSESIASLPLCVYERSTSDPRKVSKVSDHPAYALLHDEPNPRQTSYEFNETSMSHAALRGNGYALISWDIGGQLQSLDNLHPDRVKVRANADGAPVYELKTDSGETLTYPATRILHFKALSDDGLIGMGPLQLARETIGQAFAADDYARRFFSNDVRPSGILTTDNKIGNTPEQGRALKEEMRQALVAAQTGSNRNKPMIMDQGLKFQPVSLTPEDAQLLETRNFHVEDIARIFRVPQHMIGKLDRSTNNNIEHQGIEFWTNTIMPWTVRREKEFNRKLFTEQERERYFVKYNMAALLRGDIKSRFDAYAVARNWGWLSVNDIRELEDLNPIDKGDIYLQPLNMVEAGTPPAPAKELPAKLETLDGALALRRNGNGVAH